MYNLIYLSMKELIFYSALFITVFFVACDDGENFYGPIDVPDDNPKSTNEYFLANREEMKQIFTVDNTDGPVTITTDGGITITIQPHTFTVDGEPVDGNVEIELYEMLTLSSMVLSGTNTNYTGTWYGQPGYFATDGFFHISATAAGKEVDGRLAQPLRVMLPRKLSESDWTLLWPATEEAGDGGDLFAWEDPSNDWWGGEAWLNEEFEFEFEFEFDLGNLGWCNCDLFQYGQHTLTVTLTGEYGPFTNYLAVDGETYVFFAAKGCPVLAQLYTMVDSSTVQSYDHSMPDGITGRLFAFSIRDGVYTYGEKEITIDGDVFETIEMETVEKKYIDGRIASLDTYK